MSQTMPPPHIKARIVTYHDKLRVVKSWLRELYQQECQQETPQFEENETTVSILYDLCLRNKQQNKSCEIRQLTMHQQIQMTRQKSQQLKQILNQCKLNITQIQQLQQSILNTTASWSSPSVASTPMKHFNTTNHNTTMTPSSASMSIVATPFSSVRILSEIACILELKDTKTANFLIAINDLQNEVDVVTQERMDLNNISEELEQRVVTVIERIQKLKLINDEIEKQKPERDHIIETRGTDLHVMKLKANDYEERINELKQILEHNLSSTQTTLADIPHLSQFNMIHVAEAISKLRAEIEPKFQKLQTYQNLPPDLAGVKIKIGEARQELFKLEQLFHQSAQNIWIA